MLPTEHITYFELFQNFIFFQDQKVNFRKFQGHYFKIEIEAYRAENALPTDRIKTYQSPCEASRRNKFLFSHVYVFMHVFIYLFVSHLLAKQKTIQT